MQLAVYELLKNVFNYYITRENTFNIKIYIKLLATSNNLSPSTCSLEPLNSTVEVHKFNA